MNQTELLAPAGNYEALTGALSAGADAIYLGGSAFGARAYAALHLPGSDTIHGDPLYAASSPRSHSHPPQ